VQILQASVTGLVPKHVYFLALASTADGSGKLQPLASFTTNPAGSAIVNSVGPIRQIAEGSDLSPRKFLVVAEGTPERFGSVVQIQRGN
jgi:hypothetical protein